VQERQRSGSLLRHHSQLHWGYLSKHAFFLRKLQSSLSRLLRTSQLRVPFLCQYFQYSHLRLMHCQLSVKNCQKWNYLCELSFQLFELSIEWRFSSVQCLPCPTDSLQWGLHPIMLIAEHCQPKFHIGECPMPGLQYQRLPALLLLQQPTAVHFLQQ
jgi:hypothetical protein